MREKYKNSQGIEFLIEENEYDCYTIYIKSKDGFSKLSVHGSMLGALTFCDNMEINI